MLALATVFFVVTGASIFWTHSLTNEFPELKNEDSLNDTIISVIRDARATARVTFRNNRKLSLPWANNFTSQPLSLTTMVKEGDVLIKKELSDTIILNQNGIQYFFLANKTIE